MQSSPLADISLKQLKQAIAVREKIESLDNMEMELISNVEDLESLFHKINLISQKTVEEPETSHLEDSCSVLETDP